MQITIDIPEDKLLALSDIGPRLGTHSNEETLQFAIEDLIENYYKNPIGQAFGLWRNKKVDGLDYQNRIREEWNHDYSENRL